MNTAYSTLNSLFFPSSVLLPLHSSFHIPTPGGWLDQTLGFLIIHLGGLLNVPFFYLTISYRSSSILCTAQHTAFLWYCHLHTFPAIWQDDSFLHICIHAVFYIKMFSEQTTISKLIYNVNFSLRSYILARHLDFVPSAPLLSDITASHICFALLEEINGRQTSSVSDALDSQEVP